MTNYNDKKFYGLSYQKLYRFKEYIDEMYGKGYEITNFHENGNTEPFDNFYDSALEYMEEATPEEEWQIVCLHDYINFLRAYPKELKENQAHTYYKDITLKTDSQLVAAIDKDKNVYYILQNYKDFE